MTAATGSPSTTSRLRARWMALTAGGLAIAVAMVAMLPLILRRVGDADYWWHITTAKWIIDNHALPSHDLYTYTVSDHAWTDHEYLTELVMYGLRKVGGIVAVSIFFGAVTWAGFWLILKRINLRPTPALATAVALGLGAVAGVAVWGPRPQMITFALVCLELYLIERFLATGWRGFYAMPVVLLAWANLHGGFVVAFLFLGLAFLLEAVRWLIDRRNLAARSNAGRIALVAVASAVAGLLNPHFISLYVYSWRTQTSAVQQAFIREWQSPDFHQLEFRGFEAMVVLLLIGLALRRGRATAYAVVVAVAGVLLAFQSVRHIAIFVATATPLFAWMWAPTFEWLASHRDALLSRVGLEARRLVAGTALLLGVTAIVVLVVLRSLLGHQAASTIENYPSAAADYLDAHPSVGTHMFSDYAWGGYMAYRFFPEQNRRVFLFGEADLMGDQIMNEYVDVVNLHSDWLDILNRHGVDYVVFEPDTPLTSALATQSNWHLVYSDTVAVIYVRS